MSEVLTKLQDEFAKVLGPDFERDNTQQPLTVVVPLAAAVERFIESIRKNFAGTVSRGRDLAAKMHAEAYAIEQRCDELEKAGPNLAKDVEEWIKYERTANEGQKFWADLFDRK